MVPKIIGYCPSCGEALFRKDEACSKCGVIISGNAINAEENHYSLIIALFRMLTIRRKSKMDSHTTGADTFLMKGKYYSKSKYKQNLAEDLYDHADTDQLRMLLIDKKLEKKDDPFSIPLEVEIDAIKTAIELKGLAAKKDYLSNRN